MNTENLKTETMQRVFRVYRWKTFTKPIMLETGLLGILGFGSAFFISVQNIIWNTSSQHSLTSMSHYILNSFQKTEFSLKIIALAMAVLGLLIVRDVFSTAVSTSRFIFGFVFGHVFGPAFRKVRAVFQ